MSKQHVLLELSQFIHTVTAHRGNPKRIISSSLIRNSLRLLEDLPAAREIVFDYFALVAEVAVQSYASLANVDQQTGLPLQTQSQQQGKGGGGGASAGLAGVPLINADDNFGPIQEALQNLLNKGPAAWGPVIASWSLDLVGSLSDKYTKRKMSIGASCNYWLNCMAMRGLLTLISMCFRKLNNAEAEMCVGSLLAAFERYSLTFDWVVARLGGCFPLKIISQILQCSLKRFAEDYRCRYDSEIGILDHLCYAHEAELQAALRELLQEGFQPKRSIDASIIPFLVVLSNYSDQLLQHLVTVFLEMYNDELRNTIIQRAPLWMTNKMFAEMQPSMNNLALRLQMHGAKLLIAVARMAEQYAWCQDFLEYSLQELEQVVLNVRLCPLIADLATEETKYMLWKSCLSADLFEQQTAVRLLLIVSTQHSQIYYQTISELLRKSYTMNANGLGAVIRIMAGQSGLVEFPDIKPGLQMVLEDVLLQEQFTRTRMALLASMESNSESLCTFNNLNTLTKMQKRNSLACLKHNILTNTLSDCLPKILQILEVTLTKLTLYMDKVASEERERERGRVNGLRHNNNNSLRDAYAGKKESGVEPMEVEPTASTSRANAARRRTPRQQEQERNLKRLTLAHTVIELLNTIEAGSKTHVMRSTEVLKLAVLSVKYFFIALSEKSPTQRAVTVNRAFLLLQRQCSARKAARTACLRELVEGALFYHGYLFGQYEEPEVDELTIPAHEMVLVQNQRQSLAPNVTRTVLHAGVIGRGLRHGSGTLGEACNAEMQALLLKALDACCMDLDKQNLLEGYSMISLMLVELVSTDVMYNGLPFPDEEFTKVTMERDLLIRRAFIVSPVLWALLSLIAAHRPALCYSSVLLRALCATCLHQWRAKNVNKLQQFNTQEELMECTKKLLMILAMGQLLPPPLANLHMIIEHFEAHEISLLLKECVWSYLKDHVPSPALFHTDANGLHWRNAALAKLPPQYIDTLRNLMQKKLAKVGAHYHQMFIMAEMFKPANTGAEGGMLMAQSGDLIKGELEAKPS